MVRRFHANRGATLIEQMVALLLGSVMITSLYGYFRSNLYQFIALETKTGTLEDARGALDIMLRDLKNAGSWGSGSVPAETDSADDPDHDADSVCNRVYAATAGLLHVQMDLNGNGNCADNEPRENIRYELTGPTSTCPGAQIIRRNGECLVANVVAPTAGKLFSYYDADGNDLGNAPPADAIKLVRIAFAVQVKNPDPRVGGNLTSTLSSSVEFRN
ncbi:MAG: putative rane protein [Deltaproteobacteria bacterium]|nr:putative rane protein [Deltaproteobacteria bacterium]